jgi:two-component system, cell cycle response regulator
MERSRRSQKSMGLLMIDVDHFERINDTLGHPAGDLVLKEVAERIGETVRTYDSVGRYGGEEFLVVLPDCNEPQTLQRAERIRSAIAEREFSVATTNIVVTISIGATVLSCSTTSAMDLLAIADRATYQAKFNGRNRTALSHPQPPTPLRANTETERVT